MSRLFLLEYIAGAAGIFLAALVVLSPRIGPASGFLASFLAPASLASLVLGGWSHVEGRMGAEPSVLALSLLTLGLPGAVLFSKALGNAEWRSALWQRKALLVPFCLAAPIFVLLLHAVRPSLADTDQLAEDAVLLGPAGYSCGLYLLFGSTWALAGIERTVRLASESVRWEIKFLALGVAGALGAVIYVASRVLLFPFNVALLPREAIEIFPVVFLFACALVLLGWRRSTGQYRVVLSQKAIYGSVTLLAVGIYLVVSSLLAQWAGTLLPGGAGAKATVLLVAGIVLGILVLSTRTRGNLRHWVRRNLFSSRYDYRLSWLEASERIKANDPPDVLAAALADLVQKVLATGEVTVWLRGHDKAAIRLAAARGVEPESLRTHGPDSMERLLSLPQEIFEAEVPGGPIEGLDPEILEGTRASLVVPLRSGPEVLGLLTVGSDRSGHRFDADAREFVQVLASHAAGELHKGELLRAQVEAKEDEAFRSFATFLLHDLKNFASTLSLVARNAGRHSANPDFQRDAFKSIFETSEKMKRLCNSLRVFSTKPACSREAVQLNEIVEDAVRKLDAPVASRVKLDLGEVPPFPLDPEEMKGVVQNLLINAREAIPPEGSISVKTRQTNGLVSLSVADNGKGFTPEFLAKELFLPFHTTKSSGMGIGLFQCKKIVEAHGGTIEVVSAQGQGATVIVKLPVG